MRICTYIYIHIYATVRAHLSIYIYMCTHTHLYMHACMHTDIHTYTHYICLHASMHEHMSVCSCKHRGNGGCSHPGPYEPTCAARTGRTRSASPLDCKPTRPSSGPGCTCIQFFEASNPTLALRHINKQSKRRFQRIAQDILISSV